MCLNTLRSRLLIGSLAVALPLLAQETKAKAPTAEQQAMMQAWQKAATPGPNHQLLTSLAGEWTFTTKMWMEPGTPPRVPRVPPSTPH